MLPLLKFIVEQGSGKNLASTVSLVAMAINAIFRELLVFLVFYYFIKNNEICRAHVSFKYQSQFIDVSVI